jgi:hypothetical protein
VTLDAAIALGMTATMLFAGVLVLVGVRDGIRRENRARFGGRR